MAMHEYNAPDKERFDDISHIWGSGHDLTLMRDGIEVKRVICMYLISYETWIPEDNNGHC